LRAKNRASAAYLDSQKNFHRITGYKHLWTLQSALDNKYLIKDTAQTTQKQRQEICLTG